MAATVWAVRPIGDFPLNDDWIYARIVERLIDAGGSYVGHPYSMSRPVAQAYWGAAFVAMLGFSFHVLRLSTGILALAALAAVYGTSRRLGARRPEAVLGALVLLANPLFMNLSFTFMTDVPFVTMVAVSIWGYVIAFQRDKDDRVRLRPWAIFGGTAASMAALFIRQFGILPAAAWAVTAAWHWKRGRLHIDRRSILAFMAPIVIAAGLWAYYSVTLDSHFTYRGDPFGGEPFLRLLGTARFVVTAVLYLGLFLAPVSVALVGHRTVRCGLRTLLHLTATGIAATAMYLWALVMGHIPVLPAWPNVLYNLGVGPLTLRDTTIMTPGWTPFSLHPLGLLIITWVAFLSALILLSALGKALYGLRQQPNPVGSCRFGVALVAAIMLTGAIYNPWLPIVYDRYLLNGLVVLIPITAALARRQTSQPGRVAGYLAVTAMLVFSIAAAQDYFAWNRARWEGIERLKTEYNAETLRIDGGFEYSGWYLSDVFMEKHQTTDFNVRGEKGWWVMDDTYAVSFLPRSGYKELDTIPYYSYLGFTYRGLRLLRRPRDIDGAR